MIYKYNTITLARAFLAFSFLMTLLFTPISQLFPSHHLEFLINDVYHEFKYFNFYLWFENPLIPYIFSIIILLLVILGIYPRITSIFHFWVTFSVYNSMLIIEGGDQISSILTLLLIPVCLPDNRMNAWKDNSKIEMYTPKSTHKLNFLLEYNAKYALIFIKLQMAFLYLHAAVGKLPAKEWKNGTALYYWFNDAMFGAPSFIKSFFGFFFDFGLILSISSWSVIGFELLLFVSFFLKNQKIKYTLFVFAFLFHFMIVLVHGLTTFWLSMTGGLILYYFKLDLPIRKNLTNIKVSFFTLKNKFKHFVYETI